MVMTSVWGCTTEVVANLWNSFEKRFEEKQTGVHIGFGAIDEKKLNILNRTIKIDVTKRVRFTESRGQKRQGEDVEELAAKAEEQHFDDDVEVSANKT